MFDFDVLDCDKQELANTNNEKAVPKRGTIDRKAKTNKHDQYKLNILVDVKRNIIYQIRCYLNFDNIHCTKYTEINNNLLVYLLVINVNLGIIMRGGNADM